MSVRAQVINLLGELGLALLFISHDLSLMCRIVLRGGPSSPVNPPTGCRFRTRCWMAAEICQTDPALREVAPGHRAACHFA